MKHIRRRRRKHQIKLTVIMISLATLFSGAVYGYWTDQLNIDGTITTTTWDDYQEIEEIELLKTLDGVYVWDTPDTIPENAHKVNYYVTGDETPPNLGLIYVNNQNQNIRQWFKLTLTVINSGDFDISFPEDGNYILVTDLGHFKFIPLWIYEDGAQGTALKLPEFTPPGVTTAFNTNEGQATIEQITKANGKQYSGFKINWRIDSLPGGQAESITLWLSLTEQNNFWHPTTGDGEDLPIDLSTHMSVWVHVDEQFVPYDAEIPPITFYTKYLDPPIPDVSKLVTDYMTPTEADIYFPYQKSAFPNIPETLGFTVWG